MDKPLITFETIRLLGDWVPIPNCPGRFILLGTPKQLGITDLLGEKVRVVQTRSRKARDTVFVVRFDDGGTISYCRKDGTWVHTLCTSEGFNRKLQQLDIHLP